MKVNIKTFQQIFEMLPMKQRDMLLTLKKIREREDYHPEENAYEHTRIVTERCIETGDIDLILAAVFHDIFKFKLNEINEKTGNPTARGHEDEAAKMVIDNSDFIIKLGGDPGTVAGICLHHMRIKNFLLMKKSKRQAMMNQPFFLKVAIFTRADNMLSKDPMPKISGIIQDKVIFDEKEGKIKFTKKKIVLWKS